MDERSPLEARREPARDSTRSTDRLALASVVLGGFVAAIVLATRVNVGGDARLANPSPTIQVSRPQVGSQPPVVAAATAVAPTPALPSPTPGERAGERFRVANTDGQGVVLRASPNDADWTPRGFMDGDEITVLERQGADWALVRGDNGQEGWVPTRYLTQ